MRIIDVLASPGLTGFYFDDQQAIKAGAEPDGMAYRGQPLTPGFSAVRQRGESISVMLLLEDGQVAYGDCAAVQYSGAGGRDPLFLAAEFLPIITNYLRPLLIGKKLEAFRPLAAWLEKLEYEGRRLHRALTYGISQALLDGVARAWRETMAQVIAREYGLHPSWKPVPILCQTGDDRYINADKAILKKAQVLPHGLINQVQTKLGTQGEKLLEYVAWLRRRVEELGGPEYRPVLHIDVYGTIGHAFSLDKEKIAAYLGRLEEAAAPLALRIEGPVDAGSKKAQIEALAGLKGTLQAQGIGVQLVADEWCNTYEDTVDFVNAGAAHMVQVKTPDLGSIDNSIRAIRYAKEWGVGAYLGGTCNETDRSARISVHLALATGPDQMLAKPGMGVDEGFMVVYNEMQRTLALIGRK